MKRNILLPYMNNGWYIYEDTKRKKSTLFLTSPQVLLLGFAAHSTDPQNRLHVALVDGWRVQYGFGRPGQAHGQTCSAHQDTCHTWCVCTTHTHTHRHTRVKKALSMKKSCLLISMHLKMSSAWPASAGWNGPDPVRFFTGRAGTLQQKRQNDSGLTEQQHRGRFEVMFYMFRCLCIFLNKTIWECGTIWEVGELPQSQTISLYRPFAQL